MLNKREFDEPLLDNLPLPRGKGEQGEIMVLALLSVSKKGWGKAQKRTCRTHVK